MKYRIRKNITTELGTRYFPEKKYFLFWHKFNSIDFLNRLSFRDIGFVQQEEDNLFEYDDHLYDYVDSNFSIYFYNKNKCLRFLRYINFKNNEKVKECINENTFEDFIP